MFIIKNKNLFLGISIVIVLASLLSIGMYGLKKSIDFTGGAKIEFSYATTTVVTQEAIQASVEVASMLAQAKTDIQNEHQQMQSSLRAEISTLVFSSLDKIISTEIPASQKAKITAKITKDFKN
jgi:preprotein translocase subunit SecF